MSGIAAALSLAEAGISPVVIDRGRRIGGRTAVRTLRDTGTRWDGRPVDLGAAYFTARHPEFVAHVESWQSRGLARPWTDTLHVADANGITGDTVGPMRWGTPAGLRSLVEADAELLPQLPRHPVEVVRVAAAGDGVDVDGESAPMALLCGPDPQMMRLISQEPAYASVQHVLDEVQWEPALALVVVFDNRVWPAITGVFVNESPVLRFVADDGSRRGDGAAVLVAHSTPEFAANHLTEPAAGGPPMLAALLQLLGITDEPRSIHVHRWSLARPAAARPAPHFLDPSLGIGLAGDSWHDGPRLETAWLSGRSLGQAAVSQLAAR